VQPSRCACRALALCLASCLAVTVSLALAYSHLGFERACFSKCPDAPPISVSYVHGCSCFGGGQGDVTKDGGALRSVARIWSSSAATWQPRWGRA